MPHEEQREKNIRLVTEVALDCFLANGIEKTKVADIALRSGLTERSVFRYFETKADLVLAASLLYWKRILERIDRMSHAAAARPACRTRKTSSSAILSSITSTRTGCASRSTRS